MNAQEAWNAAFSQLELQLDRASFDTWLRNAAFLRYEEDVFVIGIHNSYARDMLQHRLYRNIHRVLSDIWRKPLELRFEVHKPRPTTTSADIEMPLFKLLAQQRSDEPSAPLHERVGTPERPELPESELNPRFTFERFIVNQSCRLSYQAALSVADQPASIYNPLLIHGGVGLGKTHLLQAIAHIYQSKRMRAIYIPSEVFTNDLVAAIREKTTAMFRDKYRLADVLLVDDVQFMRGKESTQEEFFHTFNTLSTFNRQIVLASDRHPRELDKLDERLRSRFAGGLVVDVQPPEFETRVAILEMWAGEQGVHFERSIYETIADRARGNVRELEGAFNQVVARARLSRDVMSSSKAKNMLEDFDRPRERITPSQVLSATARQYGLTTQELAGKRRTGRIAQARQVAMYLVREMTEASLPQIGDNFGGRTHSTVLHSCNKISRALESDEILQLRIEKIRRSLSGDNQ